MLTSGGQVLFDGIDGKLVSLGCEFPGVTNCDGHLAAVSSNGWDLPYLKSISSSSSRRPPILSGGEGRGETVA